VGPTFLKLFFLSSHNVRVGFVVVVMRVFRGSRWCGPRRPMAQARTASPPAGRTSWPGRTVAARRRRTDTGSPRSPNAEPLAVRPKKSKKKQEDEGEKVNGGDEASSGRDSLLYTLVQRLQLQRQVNATSRRSWRVHTELAGTNAHHTHAEQHAHLLVLSCLSSSSSTRIFKMIVLPARREPVGSEPGVPRPTRREGHDA
jgi:hypothetical protein